MNSATTQALSNLASLYFRQGRFADAERALRETIDFQRRLYPDGHLELALSLNNLANTLVTMKRHGKLEGRRHFLNTECAEVA